MAEMYFDSLTYQAEHSAGWWTCSSITLIYLVRTVVRFGLKVSVLVSVLTQDQDQDTNLQNRGQGQDITSLGPTNCTEDLFVCRRLKLIELLHNLL